MLGLILSVYGVVWCGGWVPAALCTVVCCAAAGGNNLFVGAGQLFRPTINTQAGTSQPAAAGRGILKHNTRAAKQTSAKFQNHGESLY